MHDAAMMTSDDGGFCIDPDQSLVDNLRCYLAWFLCREAGLTPEQVRPGKALRSYGVDSIVGARLRRGVETHFQVKVSGRVDGEVAAPERSPVDHAQRHERVLDR